MRKFGERIRISAKLIDAEAGDQMWAERYDRTSQDAFALLDLVVEAFVAMLENRMVMQERQWCAGSRQLSCRIDNQRESRLLTSSPVINP